MSLGIVELIDRALEKEQEQPRSYLGASILGQSCPRKIWYDFHWVTSSYVPGRMKRLFDRGHREESRFCAYLRLIGGVVHEVDPETGGQFGFTSYKGHFKGSADAILENVPGCALRCLAEFKTHNSKSFEGLTKSSGVREAKLEHYVQMQVYLGELALPECLYLAVNKDNDALYAEVVKFDEETYDKYKARAAYIIDSPEPLPKIHSSPAWWECKFCNHAAVCHHGQEPARNCRTCAHSTPIEGGLWQCEDPVPPAVIPRAVESQGCGHYVKNPTI